MARRAAVVTASLILPAGVLVMDPRGLSPYGPAKWAAVSTVALAAVVSSWRRPVGVVAGVGPAWGLLLAAVCVAAITGLDGLYAWTGTPERNFGVLTWALCALCFFVGQRLGDAGDARWVVAVAVVTAGVAGTWTLAEALGWEPVRADVDPGRLLGPLGSAAFLGAAAALMVPMAVGCSLDPSWSRRFRWLAAASAGLCAVGLVGAGARAAWLGAATAAAVTVIVRHRSIGENRRLVVPVLVLVFAAVLGLGATLGVGERVANALDADAGGGISRIDEWRIAARVVARHPLGVGPEGYRIAFSEAVDGAYERRHGRAVQPDRAHDVLIDVALNAGLLGLVAYGVVVGLVGRSLIRAMRQSPPWVAGAAAGLLAYWVQSLFLFPIATLEPAVWVVAGLVVAQAIEPAEVRQSRLPRFAMAAVAVVGVLAGLAGSRDVLADRQVKEALVALDGGRITQAEGHADRAVRLRPDVVRYRLASARVYAASATVEGDVAAVAAFDAALDVSPTDPVVRAEKGGFLLALAQRRLAPEDISRAQAYLEALARGDPLNAELQLRIGVARALAGDTAGAEAAWFAASSLAPRSASAALNLAELYAHDRSWSKSADAAKQALMRDPGNARARELLAGAAQHGT